MPPILLTGASGQLGSFLRHWFAQRGRPVLATDLTPAADAGEVVLADLADRPALDRLLANPLSAIVHFGGISGERGWQPMLDANIAGTYNLFEAARQAGIGRIVYASSYHVQGMYPVSEAPVEVEAPFRPDSLYAVSKAFGEVLSRLYFDKFGIECLVIRICAASTPRSPRDARLWCNHDDLARLVEWGLDEPNLGHRTVYGLSANANSFFANPPAPGWAPEHGTPAPGLPDPREPLDPADPQLRRVGGAFTIWGHPDDE